MSLCANKGEVTHATTAFRVIQRKCCLSPYTKFKSSVPLKAVGHSYIPE